MSDQSSAMQGKILVIDDDPIITETIEILFDSDVTVLSTDNGRDGIALAAEEKPDLILLDVKMPDMDGYETCSELRLNPDIADIPIIFLTIKNESTDEATGLELGAIDYIAKPIVPQIIKARVKNHLTQKRQRDELENLSTIDALTGIANRRRLDEYLDTEWRRATRNKYSLSILMIDIDYFKSYNDNYGHQKGNDCLRAVAEAVSLAPRRPSDLVARYGGEEFCIVLPDTELASATEIAERVRQNVAGLEQENSGSPEYGIVTVSVGVATATPSSDDFNFDTLLELADKQLYQAKESGRNQISS
ncbi:MAG: diguanylate cyclase [Rhodospirillaceae bacterium]|nr:diguanylate cyclase [Rhodospirillaceae bacterium]MBT4588352.1 diguanylate cyclase [Rhodospirillaceae bacterium]